MRSKRRVKLGLLSVTLILLGVVEPVKADSVLIGVSGGTNEFNLPLCFTCSSFVHWAGVSFTLNASFTGVTITPTILSGGIAGTVFLTNSVGPGTTIANVVAISSFSLPNTAPLLTTFSPLSGLTLGPGTYFFLIAPSSGNAGWQVLSGANVQTAPGASLGQFLIVSATTLNPQFPPDSAWVPGIPSNLFSPIQITGTQVPEPETLLLLGTGLGVLWLACRILPARW